MDSRATPTKNAHNLCSPLNGPTRTTCFEAVGFGIRDRPIREDPTLTRDANAQGCRAQDERGDRDDCLHGVGLKLGYFGVSMRTSVEACRSLDAAEDERSCAFGVGRGTAMFRDENDAASVCGSMPHDLRQACGAGVALSDEAPGLD